VERDLQKINRGKRKTIIACRHKKINDTQNKAIKKRSSLIRRKTTIRYAESNL
jgi:hypothetical protein